MLENLDLFEGVPLTDIQALQNNGVVHRYPKNAIVVMEGDLQSHFFVIRTGKVKVYADDDDGKQVILNYLGAGQYFGELALLDNQPRSASIATLTDSELLSITSEQFRKFMLAHPVLMMGMVNHLVTTIRGLTHSVKDLALLDVYGRVARALERLSAGCHKGVETKVTHQDIANMVGASREMVSRVMKELVGGGYVDHEGGRIRINKPLPKNW